MGLRKSIIAAVLLLVTAGCTPVRSINPVGTTTTQTLDVSLCGTWKDDIFRLNLGEDIHVVEVGEGKLTAFKSDVRQSQDGVGSFDIFQFTTAVAGTNHFINARDIRLEGDKSVDRPGWRLLFYTVRKDGQSLKLYYLDDTKVTKAIETGVLKGHIEKHRTTNADGKTEIVVDSIEITAGPAELDAFMATPQALGLFTLYRKYWKSE